MIGELLRIDVCIEITKLLKKDKDETKDQYRRELGKDSTVSRSNISVVDVDTVNLVGGSTHKSIDESLKFLLKRLSIIFKISHY
ncbi:MULTISPECIES: hypothetical protein [Borreliella]|uniref:hypothetical protein n=1 Tax=Borreliella TaxID=64895 RepID=UPI0004116C13|nr:MULTISPECIES: hypothetical protein [Borreliella]AZA28351.1 hypothetical protein DB281_04720 [Borreliella garinii]